MMKPMILVVNDEGITTVFMLDRMVDVVFVDRDKEDSERPIIIKRDGVRHDKRLSRVPRKFVKCFPIKANGEEQ